MKFLPPDIVVSDLIPINPNSSFPNILLTPNLLFSRSQDRFVGSIRWLDSLARVVCISERLVILLWDLISFYILYFSIFFHFSFYFLFLLLLIFFSGASGEEAWYAGEERMRALIRIFLEWREKRQGHNIKGGPKKSNEVVVVFSFFFSFRFCFLDLVSSPRCVDVGLLVGGSSSKLWLLWEVYLELEMQIWSIDHFGFEETGIWVLMVCKYL